jgi:ribosome-associated protein
MKITSTLSIPDNEVVLTFIRASGPGGQNVNKVSTTCQLRFDIRNSPVLPLEVKERLLRLAGTRLTQEGVIIIEAKRYRTQEQNRHDAEARLVFLIQKAMTRPKKRRPTRPSMAAKAERIETKKRRGTIKRLRQSQSNGNE